MTINTHAASDNQKATRRSGPVPYGYRLGHIVHLDHGNYRPIQLDMDEAEVIIEIHSAHRRGEAFAEIARVLNERMIPTPGGGEWNTRKVSAIIHSEHYLGHVDGFPTIVAPGNDETIHARPTAERRTGSRRAFYALNGLVRCALCAAKMEVARYNRNVDEELNPRFVKFRCRKDHTASSAGIAPSTPQFRQQDSVPLINAWLSRALTAEEGELKIQVGMDQATHHTPRHVLTRDLDAERFGLNYLKRHGGAQDLVTQTEIRIRDIEQELAAMPTSEMSIGDLDRANATVADVLSRDADGIWAPEYLRAAYEALGLKSVYDGPTRVLTVTSAQRRKKFSV